MNPDLAVLAIIRDDSAIMNIINGNVFIDEAPQGVEMPYVIVEHTDSNPFPTKSGVSVTDEAFINVFSYGRDSEGKERFIECL
jgi:hypothetical protein